MKMTECRICGIKGNALVFIVTLYGGDVCKKCYSEFYLGGNHVNILKKQLEKNTSKDEGEKKENEN